MSENSLTEPADSPPSYLAFWDIARMDKSVESSSPVPVDQAFVLRELLPGLQEQGEFFGLVDQASTTLQVLLTDNQDGPYWVEVPCPDLGGSYGLAMAHEPAQQFFQTVRPPFSTDGYQNFLFESW